ncbi:MAG: PTS sugar transporter subunit IIB [Erysipelotrichaceae bacterium]|nr:PTS sugar transporter subunit IIB [Erysipelotrichaceae bacterium]
MIKLVRLDERMIHGQVATKWSRVLGVNRIIVADDMAANSDTMKNALMMAAPATCKVAIVTVDKAIELCNDPRSESLSILLIVASIENLLRVAKEVKGVPQINVGNYGRIAPKVDGAIRDTYSKNLYAYDSEVALLKEVMATGIPCNVQTIPDDAPVELSSVVK